jgi:uncharacterized repeat protein (TIGR01451 family)
MKANIHPPLPHWFRPAVWLIVLSMLAGFGLAPVEAAPILPESSRESRSQVAAPVEAQISILANLIRISQVYGGGGNYGSIYTHDFVELLNTGADPVSLDGWSVQYASASGSTWYPALLSGAIEPGKYYLIQLGSGGGGVAPLPDPDAVGAYNISATAGKIALVSTTTPLADTCPTQGIIDFVGYGSNTNCYEGSGPAPAPSNTTSVMRFEDGCIDTDENLNDFFTIFPLPRNSASPGNYCGESLPGDITIAKTGPAFIEPGDLITYTIVAANWNNPLAAGLVITDTLPDGLIYHSDTSGVTPENPEPGVFVWSLGDLGMDEEISFELSANSDEGLSDGTILTNQVVVSGEAAEDDPDNNTAQFNTTVSILSAISEVRAGSNGQVFMIEGKVTVQPGMYGPEWALQDDTGGIAIYYTPAPVFLLGDTVRIRATRGTFNGQEQLVAPVSFADWLASGPEVEPLFVTSAQVAAGETEGLLVGLDGIVSGLTGCASSYTFFVDDGSGPAQIFIHSLTGVNICSMGVENGSQVHISGFSSQYNAAYQVKVRQQADVTLINTRPEIAKQAPRMVAPGDVFTYTISVGNHLGYDLIDILVTDTIPDNVEYIWGGSVEPPHVVYWEIPVLEDQEIIQLQFSVTATETAGLWINNYDYSISAANYITPTFGAPVYTAVAESLRIHHLQGPGDVSPFAGEEVADIPGVVTFIHNQGFFMQEPEPDLEELTSEGIFVYTSAIPGLVVGSSVIFSGTVEEYYGMTRISTPTIEVSGPGPDIPPLDISLPVPVSLEQYESMLVSIPQVMTVSQNYFLGRYGQVTLSSDGRMYHPNNGNDLGDTWELNLRRTLVLDDGTSQENPIPIPYLGEDNTLRAGDTTAGLVGVIDYGIITSGGLRHYRLHPSEEPVFERVNERTTGPQDTGGALKIASFNVLNYFNGNGMGGGFPTPRGASTLEEFERQRTKIIAAVLALDADVIGLVEMENDGTGPLSALQDLVNGLNTEAGEGVYALVEEPAPGTDEIKVSIIYRTDSVIPIGSALNYQVTDHPDYTPLFDRPPLAQVFADNSSGEIFSVVVNHFKSKSSCPPPGNPDADQGDGQGCWNVKRLAQAEGLLDLIDILAQADPEVLVIGDLNSYGLEDPVLTLAAGGLQDQLARFVPSEERYSYTFDGMAGYLDHTLATPTLAQRTAGSTIWHINTDEPTVLDYNMEHNPPELYSPDPYRSSDHDPVLVGIVLDQLVAGFISNSPVILGELAVFTNTTTGPGTITYEWDFGDGETSQEEHPSHLYESPGVYQVTLTATNEYETDTATGTFEVVDQLVAGFTSNSPVILGELAVFTNTTTGPGTITYEWDFGDGETSQEEHPSHLYESPGVYQVTLAATNEYETDTATGAFEVVDQLVAGFTSNSPVVLGELAVFTNTTTGPGTITFEWDFGDGETSTETSPSHLYESPGVYQVTLTATNEYETDTATGTFEVVDQLVAGFTSNSPVILGELAVFTNTTTGPGMITYEWDFGDGETSQEEHPSHLYESPGIYQVTLAAENEYQTSLFQGSFQVLVPADLVITKTVAAQEPVSPGEVVTYTISLQNDGEECALDITLEDSLPEALEWIGWIDQPGGFYFDNGIVSWSGDLAGGAELAASFLAALLLDPYGYGEQVVNEASITLPGGFSLSAAASFQVIGPPELTIEKYAWTVNTPVLPGDVISYTIVVSNTGPATAYGVVIRDELPDWVEGDDIDLIATIEAGTAREITINGRVALDVPLGITIINTANYSHSTGSSQASARFNVTPPVEFQLFMPVLVRQD